MLLLSPRGEVPDAVVNGNAPFLPGQDNKMYSGGNNLARILGRTYL